MSGQNPKSGTEVAQWIERKYPKTDVRYWEQAITKRKYTTADDTTHEVATYQVRLTHDRRREWFNLQTAEVAAAAAKARDRFLFLKANGWSATLAKFKPQTAAPSDGMTISQFCDLYREVRHNVDDPVSHQTAERYIKSLEFICRDLRIGRLDALTPQRVEKFKVDYQAKARKEKRDPESVKVSCNAVLRNAAGLFSKPMLAEYRKKKLAITNPFEGQRLRGVVLETYRPVGQAALDRIWQDAVLLRDGDPSASAPDRNAPRWEQHDFRKPNVAAYGLLLLELGLGLRRNEADKSQRGWLHVDKDGERYLMVQKTPYFTPKSKESRAIRIDADLYAALEWVMAQHVSPFIVPGALPKKDDEYADGERPSTIRYRCDVAHRALAAWLRQRGLTSDKPCHQLRKEFGAYVATSFGLFAAQKLLGHSSPVVTEQFYAALTQLPKLENVKLTRITA